MVLERKRKTALLPARLEGIWRRPAGRGLGWVVACLWLAAGCGQPAPLESWEEFPEEPYRRGNIIGFDPRGMPVYGVDDDGNPVYKPVPEPDDPEH